MTESIQLVTGGLNLDSDEHFQPENTISYGENGRIFHLGGGNYSWHNMEGNAYNFSICGKDVNGVPFIIIGWHIVRSADTATGAVTENLVVHSAPDAGGDGEIGVVTFDTDGTGTYVAYYRKAELNYSTDNPIEGFGWFENDNIQRAYWTDRFRNPPRAINLITVHPIAILNYTSIVEFITGTEYLVNCGIITESYIAGGVHAIYDAQNSAGPAPYNYFTADTTLYTYSGLGGTSVSVYFPWQLLAYTPRNQIGEIDHVKRIPNGYLYYGTYFFAYNLGTNDGFETDWTELFGPVPILGLSGTGDLDEYQQDQAQNYNENSGNGLEGTITGLPVGIFDYIKIVAFFSNDLNVSGDGTIIAKIPITTNVQVFDYYGNKNLGTVTVDDVTISTIAIEGCKTLTEIKYHHVIANLRERKEFTADITATLSIDYYKMPLDQRHYSNGVPQARPQYQIGSDELPTAMCGTYPVDGSGYVQAGQIAMYQWYEVMTGTIAYPGGPYAVGSYFQGTNQTTFTGGNIRPVIRYRRYTDSGGNPVYKNIPITDYLDYKGLASTRYLKGLWGKEIYRYGVMFLDLYGKPYFVRWLGDVTVPIRSHFNSMPGTDLTLLDNMDLGRQLTAQIAHLVVSNLDLTGIIDLISGFSIVMAPPERNVLSEGVLMAQAAGAVDGDNVDRRRPMRTCSQSYEFINNFVHNPGYWRSDYNYEYYSPEHLFNYKIPQLQTDDYLEIVNYYSDIDNPIDGTSAAMWKWETDNFHLYKELFALTLPQTAAKQVGATVPIDWWIPNIAVWGDQAEGGSYTYRNRTNYDLTSRTSDSQAGNKKTLIGIMYDDNTYGFGDWYVPLGFSETQDNIPIVNHIRQGGNNYGGQTPDSLAATEYAFAGHYQVVDAAFKAAIKTTVGGKDYYIVNNIDVFGGDCFICIMDYCRIMKDNNTEDISNGHPEYLGYSHSILVPLQSNVNVAMRQGHHISRNRSFENNGSPVIYHHYSDGIGYTTLDANTMQWEEFNYNKAYSTQYLTLFPALPTNYFSQDKFDMRARYTPTKIPGEIIDNFRIFPAINFTDVDTWAGQINNVRNKSGRLYYWQDRAVGYMPVNEKTMFSDAVNQAVQLGVGGVFTSFEENVQFYGNQHQWGLVDVEDGFCWIDWRRRTFIHMTVAFGITQESLKKGISSLLHNPLFNPLEQYDNCLKSGILLGFDAEYRNVYITAKIVKSGKQNAVFSGTIIYDTLAQKFIGLWSEAPTLYHSVNSFFYSAYSTKQLQPAPIHYNVGDEVWIGGANYVCVSEVTYGGVWTPVGDSHWVKINSQEQVWQHNHAPLGIFYGAVKSSIIEVIMNKSVSIAKVGDNIIVHGNEIAFNSLTASTVDQTVTENVADLNNNVVNKNYKYVKKAWYSSLPLFNREKLQGDWIKMRFTFDNRKYFTGTYNPDPTTSRNNKVSFSILKTLWRKFF